MTRKWLTQPRTSVPKEGNIEHNRYRFPFKDLDKYSDVRTIAERAGVALDEEGHPYCCGVRMQTKGGLMGPDYAKCHSCGTAIWNAASPHVNGGLVFSETVYELFGDQLWTFHGAEEPAL